MADCKPHEDRLVSQTDYQLTSIESSEASTVSRLCCNTPIENFERNSVLFIFLGLSSNIKNASCFARLLFSISGQNAHAFIKQDF